MNVYQPRRGRPVPVLFSSGVANQFLFFPRLHQGYSLRSSAGFFCYPSNSPSERRMLSNPVFTQQNFPHFSQITPSNRALSGSLALSLQDFENLCPATMALLHGDKRFEYETYLLAFEKKPVVRFCIFAVPAVGRPKSHCSNGLHRRPGADGAQW